MFLVFVLLVSWWSLNCVSVVVGALVALWWCVRSVLTVFGNAVCCSCLGGVSVVSWRCSGVVFSWYLRNDFFLTKLARLSTPNWRQRNETRHFAIMDRRVDRLMNRLIKN